MLKNWLWRYKCLSTRQSVIGVSDPAHELAAGVTLIELLVTMVFIGVLASLAAPVLNGNFGTRPLDDSTNRVASTLSLLRVKATSQTTAYRFRQGSTNNVFIVEYSKEEGICTATSSDWASDGSFNIDDRTLGKNVTFSSVITNPAVTPWSVCFDNRGQADRSIDIRLASSEVSETRRIQVFEGGAIQIY